MEYYIIFWIVEILSIGYTAAVCGEYTTEVTNDAKISSNNAETLKTADIMKTTCTDYCMPVSETTDCAVSYIANDVGSPDGPGECSYYGTNCGAGCSTDPTIPGVVIVFTCIASGCGPLASPVDGLVDLSNGTITDSIATYSCNLGYQLSGSATRTCGLDGTWTSSAPVCSIVNCGVLSNPANGLVDTSSGTLPGNQATYSCNLGYQLSGSSTRTCGLDGTWTSSAPVCNIINCGVLSNPANGLVDTTSGTLPGNQATYSCNLGYQLSGSSTRTCGLDGTWTNSAPVCNIINCGVLSNPANGLVDTSSGTLPGNQAIYSCNLGYQLSGSSTRTCGLDGTWTNSAPVCNIINCGVLSNPANGLVDTSSGTLPGNQATYSCNHGYTLNGENTTTCDTTGFWNTVIPSCDIIDCGYPGALPTNGFFVTSAGTTYLQEAVYSCNEGYVMEGVNTRICQSDGLWNGTSPSCNAIDCGPLTAPNNGVISLPYGTTFSMVAMYSCTYGYVIHGAVTRTCLVSGFWSGSQPYCADIRSVECLAAKEYPGSIKMRETNTGVLQTFSLLMSTQGVNVVTCVRMCTTQFRETCDQQTACLLINYDINTKMCHLYHSDMNGPSVMCNASSQCFLYEYYEFFV